MNASPLIGLANLDGLAWLRKLYGRARITPTVRSRIDVRSVSRLGTSDLGKNARRVRAYLRDLKG